MAKAKKERVNTIQEVRSGIDPQLCKTYNADKHDWTKSWEAEPKFDGLRCIMIAEIVDGVRKVTAYTRNGKPLWNMDPILNEVNSIQFSPTTEFVLDGEVFSEDWNLTMSIVKRSTQTHPDQDKLRFHVWDYLSLAEWNEHYTDKKKQKVGRSLVSNHDRKRRLSCVEGLQTVQFVEGIPVGNPDELAEAYKEFLLLGYEGAILKEQGGSYECGRRSSNWLKIKPWTDADLTIVGAYAGEGKHLGRIGGLVLEGQAEWNGYSYSVRTEVGTGFTDVERESFQKLWDEDDLNGRIVEIKFQDITVDNKCRFPVYHRLREDK